MFNYNNIGNKVKGLAKWSFYISFVLIVAACIIFILFTIVIAAQNNDSELLFYIPLAPIVGCVLIVVVWISTWLLYAFGELVESNKIMSDIMKSKETYSSQRFYK